MLRFFLGAILFILLIMVIGNVILEEFPGVQPLFDELKMHVVNLYNTSIVRYGTITTLLIILGIFILVGSSKRM